MNRKVVGMADTIDQRNILELARNLYFFMKNNYGEPKCSDDVVKILDLKGESAVREAQRVLNYLADVARELEPSGELRGIEKIYLSTGVYYQYFDHTSVNRDFFRDYDYRSPNKGGIDFSAKRAWYMVQTWIDMLEDKCKTQSIENNRTILIVHDSRKMEKDVYEAQMQAAQSRGYEVKFIDSSASVSEYSWAVQVSKPAMAIFDTASHISVPADKIVAGAKVAMVGTTGLLESISTNDIKQKSWDALQKNLIEVNELRLKNQNTSARQALKLRESFVEMARSIGLVASGLLKNLNLYQLDQVMRKAANIESVTDTLARNHNALPFSGLRIVVEGAHTASGPLAADSFKSLGATVDLLNGDVQEIVGPHKADPSKTANLDSLFKRMIETDAHMGMAFDLDGDRGAIVLRNANNEFTLLAPDQLGQVLIPFLTKEGGYSAAGQLAFVKDVLSSDSVNDEAARNKWEVVVTDAGYVYLKEAVRKLEAEGTTVPMYGEKSGHAWMSITGAIENPIILNVVFTSMMLRLLEAQGQSIADTSAAQLLDTFKAKTIPYNVSTRFQPLFTDAFLTEVADLPTNDTGWVPGRGTPPSKVIGLARDLSIKALEELLPEGKKIVTTAGTVRVESFDKRWDEESQIYRFGKVRLSLDGEFIGSFVTRGSSNDPTAVQVFEANQTKNDGTLWSEEDLQRNFNLVGGLVLDVMSTYEIIIAENVPGSGNMNDVLPALATYRAELKNPWNTSE